MLFTLKQAYFVFKIFVQIVDTENNQPLNSAKLQKAGNHRSHFVFAKKVVGNNSIQILKIQIVLQDLFSSISPLWVLDPMLKSR